METRNTFLALLVVVLSPTATIADVHTYEIFFEGDGVGQFQWDTENKLISNLTWDFGAGMTGGANIDWTLQAGDGTLSQLFFEIITGVDLHPSSCTGSGGCGLSFSPSSVLFGYPDQQFQLNVYNNVRTFFIRDSNFGYLEGEFSVRFVRPATFNDVPAESRAFQFIETLVRTGITAGCGGNNYCPNDRVTRAQLAVFLQRGMNGHSYAPPAATGRVFFDVAPGDFAASFIEQLFWDRITTGCGNSNYCPSDGVSRAQLAVFLLRAKHGPSYSPPSPYGLFEDVPASHWAAAWIEALVAEGITAGCGGGNYCPEASVTRAQMAVFLVRTFGL